MSTDLLVHAIMLCVPGNNSLMPLFFAYRVLRFDSNISQIQLLD